MCGAIVSIVTKKANLIDNHVGARVRMRRMMLGISQTKLADAVGLTFQQIRKYEKGTNRISASRLQEIAGILQVPIGFFFEGAPDLLGLPKGTASSPDYVSQFLATRDGLALIKAFTQVKNVQLRRCVVSLVKAIADHGQK
jgi:transcriptional regulator with XRE-family HTH domain